MKTYVINFTNGRKIRITGEPVEPVPEGGVVVLRSGVETYNILKENILYWSVCDGETLKSEDPVQDLTDRQKKILDGMARGKTNRAIGHELGYSESTIRQESMAIYRMLGVSSREDAVRAARLDNPVQV